MTPSRLSALCAAAVLFSAVSCTRAEIKLPAIFGDHMVLQEGVKIPVWGSAAPGEEVTVSIGPATVKATADDKGNWKAVLPLLSRQSAPTTMKVSGKNTILINDVLVGDVWICSGQSNMEFPLAPQGPFKGDATAAQAIPAAHDQQLRLFLVQRKTSLQPVDDVTGHWQVCSPEAAALFSAVGYFFGLELRQHLNKPIGLIGTYWGGTPAQAWTSLGGLQKDPALSAYVAAYQKNLADFPAKSAAYPSVLAAYNAKVDEMTKAQVPSKQRPWPPLTPDGSPSAPTNLFNGMIAPLIPYAIKGVIWYQGESNAKNPIEYRKLFPDMIGDWREKWGQGDFPFLFVQLARFRSNAQQDWAFLREAQLQTLAVPQTGMAVTIDIGDPLGIHPTDKLDVGHRLALAARHVAYGEDLVYSGPLYDSMTADGATIKLTFKNTGGGLIIGAAPWVAADSQPIPTTSLVGFSIAGDDHKWIPADAKIVDDAVLVSSPQVPHPVAARYDWGNTPSGNLYNKEGLPASPFRTDDFPLDLVADVIAPAPPPAGTPYPTPNPPPLNK